LFDWKISVEHVVVGFRLFLSGTKTTLLMFDSLLKAAHFHFALMWILNCYDNLAETLLVSTDD